MEVIGVETFKIYLAGGVSNLNKDEYTLWRNQITRLLLHKSKGVGIKYSVDIISPPDYFAFEEKNYETDLEVMKYYLRHTKSSDLIIVNFNDPNSIGTAQELAVGYDRNIPILGLNMENKELNSWLVCSCDRIFDNYESLVKYVIEFYLI
jgi:hypothetical protein